MNFNEKMEMFILSFDSVSYGFTGNKIIFKSVFRDTLKCLMRVFNNSKNTQPRLDALRWLRNTIDDSTDEGLAIKMAVNRMCIFMGHSIKKYKGFK